MYMQIYYQYLYVLYVLEHWDTETTTASPKHTLVTHYPRITLRAPQGMCLTTFRPHPTPPPAPDFFIFSSRISVWTCFATALESARTL